jgi:hypothetical protein
MIFGEVIHAKYYFTQNLRITCEVYEEKKLGHKWWVNFLHIFTKIKFFNKYLFQFELINHFDRNFITTYSVVKKNKTVSNIFR